jgi:hypothetical protein
MEERRACVVVHREDNQKGDIEERRRGDVVTVI